MVTNLQIEFSFNLGLDKDDCLNKSFYTLEYRDNRVVQCYGFRNCRMTDEVKEFVKEFEIAMNNREIQMVS